jgi:hypothetical protein
VKLLFDYVSRNSKPVVAPFQNPRLEWAAYVASVV